MEKTYIREERPSHKGEELRHARQHGGQLALVMMSRTDKCWRWWMETAWSLGGSLIIVGCLMSDVRYPH